MLIKVTAMIETVVYVDTDNEIEGFTKAKEAIVADCYESLRKDLGNCMCSDCLPSDEISLGFKKIGPNELPNGWDKTCVPWGDSGGQTIATLCQDGKCHECTCCCHKETKNDC